MKTNIKSTYDELMESMSPQEKQAYDKELKNFIQSELALAIAEEDSVAAQKLAKLSSTPKET